MQVNLFYSFLLCGGIWNENFWFKVQKFWYPKVTSALYPCATRVFLLENQRQKVQIEAKIRGSPSEHLDEKKLFFVFSTSTRRIFLEWSFTYVLCNCAPSLLPMRPCLLPNSDNSTIGKCYALQWYHLLHLTLTLPCDESSSMFPSKPDSSFVSGASFNSICLASKSLLNSFLSVSNGD